MIGIIGGMGPYAGADLFQKITSCTRVSKDQEHLPIVLLSVPEEIPDRTAFLLDIGVENPAVKIAELGENLAHFGCSILAIACNTAHSPQIFDKVALRLAQRCPSLRIVSMIDSAIKALNDAIPAGQQVGVLSTTGTYRIGTYRRALLNAGFEVWEPPLYDQEKIVHEAIYNIEFGLKVHSSSPHPMAITMLQSQIDKMKQLGVQAVIMGCTELSFALPKLSTFGMKVIDPNLALARSLVHAFAPDRLRA